MNDGAWERYADDTFELWDHFVWLLAQWLCQSRGLATQGRHAHIRNPAEHNDPCDHCYRELAHLLDPGLCEVIGVLGSTAYRLGLRGVAEREAAVLALREVVDVLVRREESKRLLAEAAGEAAWWKLSIEPDQRKWPQDDGNP